MNDDNMITKKKLQKISCIIFKNSYWFRDDSVTEGLSQQTNIFSREIFTIVI